MSLRRLKLDLKNLMAWFSDMVKAISEEITHAEKTKGSLLPAMPGGTAEAAMHLLQLLGALRHVINTSPQDEAVYPDPLLLQQGIPSYPQVRYMPNYYLY